MWYLSTACQIEKFISIVWARWRILDPWLVYRLPGSLWFWGKDAELVLFEVQLSLQQKLICSFPWFGIALDLATVCSGCLFNIKLQQSAFRELSTSFCTPSSHFFLPQEPLWSALSVPRPHSVQGWAIKSPFFITSFKWSTKFDK